MKIRIELNRENCISCQACAFSDPEDFEMSAEDGKSTLKEGTENNGTMTKEIEANDDRKEKAVTAAKGCPVSIIKVYNAENNEQIAP